MFGSPVGLNFNGSSKFKSTPGAVVTLIMTVFILIVCVQKLILLIGMGDPDWQENIITLVENDLESDLNLVDMHANFGFGFYNTDDRKYRELDPRIGRIVVVPIKLQENELP